AKAERLDRQTTRDQRRNERRRSRNRNGCNAAFDGQREQAESRIGNSRRPGIADYRDPRSRSKLLDEFRRPRGLIVLVIAGRTRGYSVMIEQLLRLTGVLAGDEINLLQHSNGAQGDVFEIADRRGNEVEARGDWLLRRDN